MQSGRPHGGPHLPHHPQQSGADGLQLPGIHCEANPFYTGRPWMLPMVGNWYRFRDWLNRRAA
jgi:hypothetical protein